MALSMQRAAQARLGLSRGEEEVMAEVRGVYERLMALDPLRRGFYADALSGKARVVVQPPTACLA
jgi:geranylgeranyl transferase type-2 subunit alpha